MFFYMISEWCFLKSRQGCGSLTPHQWEGAPFKRLRRQRGKIVFMQTMALHSE
jgi:hypothetical protein